MRVAETQLSVRATTVYGLTQPGHCITPHSAPPRLQSASPEGEASCRGSSRPLDAPPVPAALGAGHALYQARPLAEERRAHDGRFGAGGVVGEHERLHELEAVRHHLVQQLGRAHAPEEGGHQRPSACRSEAPSSVAIRGAIISGNQRRHHQWQSEAPSSVAIRGAIISGNPRRRRGSTSSHTYLDVRSVSGNQWQSVAISGNQWQSPRTWT